MIYCAICGRPTSNQGPEVCAACAPAATVEVAAEIEVPAAEAATGQIRAEIGGQPVTLVEDGGYWKVVHLGAES